MKSNIVFKCVFVVFMICSLGVNLVWAEVTFCAVGWYGEFTHISPTLGEVEPTRTDLPVNLQALARSRNGTLYAGKEGALYTIDPYTGSTELFIDLSTDIRGMAFSGSNELYITAQPGSVSHEQRLRILDTSTGNYSEVGDLWGDGTASQGLAFSSDGTLYGISPIDSHAYKLFTIDLDDGEMHLIGSYTMPDFGGGWFQGVSQSITFSSDGSLYAVGTRVFAQLNPETGAIIGDPMRLSGDYRGLAIIPEPTTVLLLGLGGLLLRRKPRA